jgi:hypothetical protein
MNNAVGVEPGFECENDLIVYGRRDIATTDNAMDTSGKENLVQRDDWLEAGKDISRKHRLHDVS